MKKLYFLIVICLLIGMVARAQYVNIPDSNFNAILIKAYPSCFNNLGQLDTTCDGIITEDSLYCSNASIKDITGIQYFKRLSYLNCDSNLLTTLNILPNTLHYLFCSNNQLVALPTLPDSLYILNCEYNQLSSLPSLSRFLNSISCEVNQLQTMPSLPDSLKILICAFNHLKKLPSLPVGLKIFDCGGNLLTSLPVLPTSLQYFFCYGNQLISIPSLPNRLSLLDCDNNSLSNLPILPDTLNSLACGNNNITALPSKLPNTLKYLDVSITPISSLPAFDSLYQLQFLNCQGDSSLACLPRLPNSLDSLNVNNTSVRCIPNNIGNDNIYPNGLPICNPTNNRNQCNAFPIITGRVFYDNNSNGIKDSDEYYIPFIPISLNTGVTAFSNNEGKYNLTMTDTGSATLSVVTSPFYRAVPSSINFSFTSFEEQLALTDIAIQPNELKDSLDIHIYPWENALVGRKIVYSVAYRNMGTINSFGTASFIYDTSKLIFDSASVPLLSNSGNTLKWQDTLSAHYYGNKYFRSGYQYPFFIFSVKPTAIIGDVLNSSAMIASVTSSAVVMDSMNIKGSYDPNSKEASPIELSTKQIAEGNGINYTIHFQNVGNSVANNIVITDTLSNLLNPSQFQIIGHSCFPSSIGIVNNIVYFQFLNINLVDSGTDQLKSNGFIQFRVQPEDTLSVGSYIRNNASIYFDYNAPVVTNIATTVIKNSTLPVSISSYQLSNSNGNVESIQNKWTTANELNTKSFNIQRSNDGTNFKTIGHVIAKGFGSNDYFFTDNTPVDGINYYRLQIIDKDGSISYSKTISILLIINNYQLSIYPNPATHYIMVSGENIEEVSVIDNLGRVVSNKKLNVSSNTNRIDLKLSSGLYIVHLRLTDGRIVNEKLVVE